VFLLGRSLGGAVAIHTLHLLEQKKIDYFQGAIIENTFTSISQMAESVFPMFKLIPGIKNRMLRLKWESIKYVSALDSPLFFISGDADTFVPTEQTWQLFNEAARSAWKECWIVPGGNHNTTYQVAGLEYFNKLRNFMDRCLRKDFVLEKFVETETAESKKDQ
jgi:fermentation-respiration switch protein FrsA (DUF1100 family)